MKQFGLKNFLIISLLFLTSCSLLKKNNEKRIRIVDLQGKSHGVKTRVPPLNAQILRSQGKMPENGDLFTVAPASGDNYDFGGTANSQGGEAIKNKYAQDNISATDQGLQNANNTANYNTAPTLNPESTPMSTHSLNDVPDSKVKAGDMVVEQEIQEVEYDLSDNKNVKQSPKKTAVIATYSKEPVKKKVVAKETESTSVLHGNYVQTGAFSSLNNAKRSARTMKGYAKVQIEESTIAGKTVYRVLLGSFSSQDAALATIRKIKGDGYDAIFVKK